MRLRKAKSPERKQGRVTRARARKARPKSKCNESPTNSAGGIAKRLRAMILAATVCTGSIADAIVSGD